MTQSFLIIGDTNVARRVMASLQQRGMLVQQLVAPTEIRGIGTGFVAAVSRIGAGLGTFLLPWSMTNLGTAVSMLIAAGIAGIGAGLSQWLAPETKGKSLTETAATPLG